MLFTRRHPNKQQVCVPVCQQVCVPVCQQVCVPVCQQVCVPVCQQVCVAVCQKYSRHCHIHHLGPKDTCPPCIARPTLSAICWHVMARLDLAMQD